MSKRSFLSAPAKRIPTNVMLGLVGPSSSGKTFSAFRLATGIQRITGGDIYAIDTENGRALHYADRFKFHHVPFAAPFSPLDYLAAAEHCVNSGAKIIIVDSMSHEHEGEGGMLEWHEQEVQRMAWDERSGKVDHAKAERIKGFAWTAPKLAHRRMINTLLQMPANFIFCFRAQEKLDWNDKDKGKPRDMGWMPIGDPRFMYEMLASAVLHPLANGVPVWSADEPGERKMIKLPEYFAGVLDDGRPLNEDHGEVVARWASGSDRPELSEALERVSRMTKENASEFTEWAKAQTWYPWERVQIKVAIARRKGAE